MLPAKHIRCGAIGKGQFQNDALPAPEVVLRELHPVFPFHRFEEPAWLNEQNLTAPVEYIERNRMLLHTDRRAIAVSPFRDNRNWLFDVIYDRRVPETRSVRVPMPVRRGAKRWVIEGERAEVRDHDERVLKTALEVVRRVLWDYSNASFRISRARPQVHRTPR